VRDKFPSILRLLFVPIYTMIWDKWDMPMSVARQIKQAIKKLPTGKPFTARNLHHLGSTENVRKVLTRLTNARELRRVARGVFVKPRKVAYIGETIPSAEEIAKVVAESTGELIAVHGAEAARRLRLSTQMPIQTVFYTTGNTRQIKLENRVIVLKHVSPRKLIATGTIAGLVVSALWYLGRNIVTEKTIRQIKTLLPEKEYKKVLQEIEHMPAWMANTFHQYEQGQSDEGQFSSTS